MYNRGIKKRVAGSAAPDSLNNCLQLANLSGSYFLLLLKYPRARKSAVTTSIKRDKS